MQPLQQPKRGRLVKMMVLGRLLPLLCIFCWSCEGYQGFWNQDVLFINHLLLLDNNKDILHFLFLEVFFISWIFGSHDIYNRQKDFTKVKLSKQVKISRRKHIIKVLSTMRSNVNIEKFSRKLT